MKALIEPLFIKCDTIGILLGRGSFGEVHSIDVGESTYAGKRFHNFLQAEQSIFTETFCKEVGLLNKVRHQNIVTFIGITFDKEHIPILLMELMATTLLCHLCQSRGSLKVFEKQKWLLDVACGLKYLHNLHSCIIHRDLTASNVLLNSTRRVAKISDLGNARIIDFNSLNQSLSLTTHPGTLHYMPPEGADKNYGTGLDIFSFGHLTLVVIIEDTPPSLMPPTYRKWGRIQGRSEIERRERYIQKASEFLDHNHPLILLMKKCLNNNPKLRPNADGLVEKIQFMVSLYSR